MNKISQITVTYTIAYTVIIFFAALLLLSHNSQAGVNLKNGNFYITYRDIEMKPGFILERTYNSKSVGKGLFGNGWNSDIETRLYLMPDGNLVIYEKGLGGKTFYSLSDIDELTVSVLLDSIIAEKIRRANLQNSPSTISEEKSKLMNNLDYRFDQWMRLDFPGGNTVASMEKYMRESWQSFDRGRSKVIVEGGMFKRELGSRSELFNTKGLMLSYSDRENINFGFTISYEGELIKTVTDKLGNIFGFYYNTQQQLDSITGANSTCVYSFSSEGNLLSSRDADGNVYSFSYDKNYNMTFISYSNKTNLKIEYHLASGYVSKIIDTKGDTTRYEYITFTDEQGVVNPDRYATRVMATDSRNVQKENYYEYEIRTKLNGSRYTYRILTVINNDTSETRYDELTGNPIFERKRNDTIISRYDARGNKVFTENNKEIVLRKFNPSNKVVEKKSISKFTSDTTITTASYDTYNSLVSITINGELKLRLTYNDLNLISTMLIKGITYHLEYNEFKKPIKISAEQLGELLVEYNVSGEITKVIQPSDPNKSRQLTEALSELANISSSL